MKRLLKWNFQRNFGLEYEFCDNSRRLQEMSDVTRESTGMDCEVRSYEHTRENFNTWVSKTDASCGIELVSPILHGPLSLKKATDVLSALQNTNFSIDRHCGQHVHVEICDFSVEQVGVLAAYWMKIERLLVNGTPDHRRTNEYCYPLTHSNSNVDPNRQYSSRDVLNNMATGRQALNLGNWRNTNTKTVEFRFGDMTFDSEAIKNRIKFLIWLVELCKILPMPSNLKWFTPKQALTVFNLWPNSNGLIQYEYSPAIKSMRKWLLQSLAMYAPAVFQKDRERCQEMLVELEDSTVE